MERRSSRSRRPDTVGAIAAMSKTRPSRISTGLGPTVVAMRPTNRPDDQSSGNIVSGSKSSDGKWLSGAICANWYR